MNNVPSVHFPCCICCYLLYTFLVIQVFFFINLTTMIKMVKSEVLTRILLHSYMLSPTLSEEFVQLHWSQLNCRFSTAKVKMKISETMTLFPISPYFQYYQQVQFPSCDSVVDSLIFTASSEMSPISTATLAAAHLSLAAAHCLLSLGPVDLCQLVHVCCS